MKKPTFFILGAPKCGTTSVAMWLSEHPNIFISTYKEPHYFNAEDRRVVDTLKHYESFFRGSGEQHLAVGEASVWYLSSASAVENILKYSPDAKFVVMLRNPIEMAIALHAELCFNGDETEHDFEKAWNLQDSRRAGTSVPRTCPVPRRLLYGEVCSVGSQLQHLFAQVSRHRVLMMLLDDLRHDPQKEYRRLLAFLEVPDDGRKYFPVHNAAKVRRWPVVAQLASTIVRMKRNLGITGGLGVWRHIDKLNRIEGPREALGSPVLNLLRDYFRADVAKIETLVARDLRHWLV